MKDSIGANVVNSLCELIRPAVEELTGGRVYMAILTNPSTGRERIWTRSSDGGLVGELEMPLSVGTVGGVVNTHPVAKINLKLLGVGGAAERGLASNIGALYALVSESVKNLQ